MKARTRTLVGVVALGLFSLGTTNQPPPYCVEKTSVPRTQLPKGPKNKDIPIPKRDEDDAPEPGASDTDTDTAPDPHSLEH